MATIAEIIKLSKNGQIEEWVDAFLRTEGKNVSMGEGLKKQKRYWIGPIKLAVSKLRRCCGPEESMEYSIPLKNWNKKIRSIASFLESGGELAPLIATYAKNGFSIRDGNHRFGAVEKLGLKNCWTIIWCDSLKDFKMAKELIE